MSPGDVDYRLARNMVVSEFHKGRLSRLDICDAHPELLRAAINVGEESREDCPICEEAKVRLVSYAFGSRCPPSGVCVTSRAGAAQAVEGRPRPDLLRGRGLPQLLLEPRGAQLHGQSHPAASLSRQLWLRLRAPPDQPASEEARPARRRGGPCVALPALAVRDRTVVLQPGRRRPLLPEPHPAPDPRAPEADHFRVRLVGTARAGVVLGPEPGRGTRCRRSRKW